MVVPLFTVVRASSCRAKLCKVLTLDCQLDDAVVVQCQVGLQFSLTEEASLQVTVRRAVNGGGWVELDLKLLL